MPRAKHPPTSGLLDSWGRRNRRKYADKICPACGKSFQPHHSDRRYCSHPCLWLKNKETSAWRKGTGKGWTNKRGYRLRRVVDNGRQRSVYEHRWFVQQYLGRPLLPAEDIHHRDGDKLNNSLENLQLIIHAAHTVLTHKGRQHARGYRLDLTDEQRAQRAERMRANHAKHPEIRQRLNNAKSEGRVIA